MSELQAGKETDKRVLRAMGWEWSNEVCAWHKGSEYRVDEGDPSTDPCVVAELMEWLADNKRAHLSLEYYVTHDGEGQWHVCFKNAYGLSDEVCNPSLSLALCDAVLDNEDRLPPRP